MNSDEGRRLPPGLRILVAEDHEFQRRMLVSMLERLGAAEVHEAPSGREALKLVSEVRRPVDIIISDLDMPGMDGMELMRSLAERNIQCSLIIASAMDTALVRSVTIMAVSYGIRLLGVVEKPPQPQELARVVRLHISEKGTGQAGPLDAPQFKFKELKAGLENEQFEPFFQPKVALSSGRVCGLEALARWRHPDHGTLLPMTFMENIESGELINTLTQSMFSRAAFWCGAWQTEGLDLSVSVNFSIRSLAEVGLAERLTEELLQQRLQPSKIILEITETSAMSQVGRVLENLSRLRMKGFGLSVDDYGTGHSSMQQLDRIAATEVKIDRSLVTGAASRESGRVMLQSSLEMAAKLGLTTVAEGVETREDWDLLVDYGCDQGQGYLIARPMPAEAVAKWIRDWNSRNPFVSPSES